MSLMRNAVRPLPLLLATLILSGPARSEVVQLAELVIGSEKAGSSQPRASKKSAGQSQRDQAAGYVQDAPANTEDEDFGVLSPRGGSPAEERAFENRNRARSLQQGQGGSLQILPGLQPGQALPPAEVTPQIRANEQRSRAAAFIGRNNQDIDLSNVGRDGIPIVNCVDSDNVSGRIGDDNLSGNIVVIFRQNRQVKVRCK